MADIIKLDMTDIWASGGDKVAPSSAKIAQGWLVEVVPRQTWNWFENRQDQNIAYLLQKGFPEWDAFTEYVASKSWINRSGIIYKAILTGTNKDPVSQPTYWVKAFPESSASLEALRVLTPAADRLPYFTNGTTAALATFTSFARTLVDDVDAAAMRTTLSAQLSHANLTALASVTGAVNILPYFTSSSAMTGTSLTAFGRSLIDDADATAGRATLGLGTAATQTITTSTIDNTAGRITKVGDFGENGGDPVSQANTVDANTLTVSGTYVFPAGGINLPTVSAYYLKHVSYPTAGYAKQFAWNITTNTAFSRTQASSTWTGWEQHALGGANSDITSLSNVALTGTSSFEMFTETAVAVASAATADIGSANSNVISITGNVTITSLGNAAVGTRKQVRFFGNSTLTHNASTLILPGSANITPNVGDFAEFRSLGSSSWICSNYSRANGQPVVVVSVAQGGTGVSTSTGTGSVVKADSPTLTGTPAAPTQVGTSNSTAIATTAFVHALAASYGLDGSSRNTANAGVTTSLDTLITNGLYYNTNVLDAGPSKPPGSSATGYILVVNHSSAGSPYLMQTWVPSVGADQSMSVRRNVNGVWDAWRTLAYTDSPTFTGTPLAPTAADGTSNTQLATTAFVQTAVNGSASVSVAGTGNITLTAADIGTGVLYLTGVLTGARTVILPAGVKSKLTVSNATTGAFSLTVKYATGAGVVITQGRTTNIWADTVNVSLQQTDYPSIGLTGVPTTPTASPGTNTTQVASTAFVAAGLALKQDALGFTPVQQGTGVGQLTNLVKLGWSAASKLKATVDTSDLGNIALENWVNGLIQTSSTDSTAGRLLTVGSFGLGSSGPDLNVVTNLDTVFNVGFYKFSGAITGAPPQFAGVGGSLIVHSLGGNFVQQIAISVPGATNDPVMCIRHYNSSGVPGSWVKVFTNANIVGTVSVSGTLPTGTIFETATNANGTYTKFTDGTLINTGPIATFSCGVNAYTVSPNGTFAHPFINGSYFCHALGAPTGTNDQYGFTSINNRATTAVNFVHRNGATAQSVVNTIFTAIGRWY